MILAVTLTTLAGCGPATPPPSQQYRQEIRACDQLPLFGDRVQCAARAIHDENERRERTTP